MKVVRGLKRLLASLFCAFLVLTCMVASVLAAPGTSDSETLTVGVPADRIPVFYQDTETDEITGIGADLMRTAAMKAGYNVTFRVIKEKTLKEALDNKDYDVVMPFGSAVASSKGQPSIVSDNLMQTPFTLVTEGNHETPPLNKLRVGMLHSLGGAAETVRQLYPGIKIALYETMPDCVGVLRAGKVDALLHNSYVWYYVLQKPSYSNLTVHPMAMFSMDFRAGTLDTPKGREIIGRLNGGIAALTDTRRQAVILDHTSRRLYRYDFFDYLYQYGVIILLAILLIASLIVIAVMKYRAQEEKMRKLIDYDSLTGVYSLNGFRKRVEELVRANPETPYLLSYGNIKNFKYINDRMGKKAGDKLLRFWLKRTQDALSDKEAVCRIGADHMAVLHIAGGEESLRMHNQDVVNHVRSYFTDRGKDYRVQVCGGIYVLTPEDYRQIDVDHMLDYARVTEKRVRETRNDGWEFYNPEQWEKGKRAADVINNLPAAIQSDNLKIWYQPQVDFKTGKVTGAEALCRWAHTTLGYLQPADFISILEQTGLIYDMDCYVWDKVCQDLCRWNEQGCRQSVSVNLSRCDIREDRDLPKHFHNLIQKYGLTPDQLRIEITETAYVDNPEVLISTTKQLQELGFQVEMDDFGSGYSSLNMLKQVPVDRIKLDMRFLTEEGDPEKGRIILSSVIQMVRLLGMNLIAEGVETLEQARFLQNLGCSEMQGYYFYKPMSVQSFEKLFENESLRVDEPQPGDGFLHRFRI